MKQGGDRVPLPAVTGRYTLLLCSVKNKGFLGGGNGRTPFVRFVTETRTDNVLIDEAAATPARDKCL